MKDLQLAMAQALIRPQRLDLRQGSVAGEVLVVSVLVAVQMGSAAVEIETTAMAATERTSSTKVSIADTASTLVGACFISSLRTNSMEKSK